MFKASADVGSVVVKMLLKCMQRNLFSEMFFNKLKGVGNQSWKHFRVHGMAIHEISAQKNQNLFEKSICKQIITKLQTFECLTKCRGMLYD